MTFIGLSLATGALELVAKNPGNVVDWVVDADLKVRGAVACTPDGGTNLLIRDNDDSDWKNLITWDMEDSMASRPIGFTKDGNELYLVDSKYANAGRLIKMNLSDLTFRVIEEDPQYDAGDVIIHPDTCEI